MPKLIFKYKEVSNSITVKTPQGKKRGGKERNFPIVIDDIQMGRVTIPKEKGGGKDMNPNTLKSIRNQLLLNPQQFAEFVTCSMSSAAYIDAIKQKYPDTFKQ
ncbi:MAG: hypothetical protein A2Z28_03735 [Chloroflexi bacterium RBG_16_51_9]|nr:MAG: hypothetical protein A2Z28_03735 [Chloroflexi bacterium RBG_16_51_9]